MNFRDYLKESVQSDLDKLKQEYQPKGIRLFVSGSDIIEVKVIKVPDELQGKGLGTEIMLKIQEIAKKYSIPIQLTQSSDFGGSKQGLNRFYKKLGFVQNKGKNRDFRSSEDLIWYP